MAEINSLVGEKNWFLYDKSEFRGAVSLMSRRSMTAGPGSVNVDSLRCPNSAVIDRRYNNQTAPRPNFVPFVCFVGKFRRHGYG